MNWMESGTSSSPSETPPPPVLLVLSKVGDRIDSPDRNQRSRRHHDHYYRYLNPTHAAVRPPGVRHRDRDDAQCDLVVDPGQGRSGQVTAVGV